MSEHTHEHELYTGIVVEKKPESLAEIHGEIPLGTVEAYRMKAVRHLGRDVEIPGFRKGHVPPELFIERLGELRILEEVAEMILGHGYGHILADNKLNAIGRPTITLTKLAPGTPIAFTIQTALYPEITLPDYKKVAHDAVAGFGDPNEQSVTEEEVVAELTRVRGLFRDKSAGPDADLPVLDDALVSRLGDFKSVADFTEKLKEQMLLEKKRRAYEKRRIALADALVAQTKADLPAIMIDYELDRMRHEFEENLARMGIAWKDYLVGQNKTEEDLRGSWRDNARKRSLLDVVLTQIARTESIEPEAEHVEREVTALMEHHPEADEERVRTHVTSALMNEKVFALLEAQV